MRMKGPAVAVRDILRSIGGCRIMQLTSKLGLFFLNIHIQETF